MAKKLMTIDGNTAAAHVAYAFTEVASDTKQPEIDGNISVALYHKKRVSAICIMSNFLSFLLLYWNTDLIGV